MSLNIFEMVHQVLGEAKEKLAADESAGTEKTSAVVTPQAAPQSQDGSLQTERLFKLADAADHLAKNIHLVNDERSPQEKLAEYAAIHNELQKAAFDVGNSAPPEPSLPKGEGDKGSHQTTQANPESQSPKTVALDDSGTGIGQGNAIPSEQTDSSGTGIEAGAGGEAMGAHQSPKSVTPSEKAQPMDAANALETNKGMMKSDQPEDLLKQPGGDQSTGSKTASRASRILDRLSGKDEQDTREKVAQLRRASVLMQKAAHSGIPTDVAAAMISMTTKVAEDNLNPAKISGGTEPVLQSEPAIPSPLSQGSEAGSNTPRESAPTSGEGGGREALTSNEAAINATKGQTKRQNKGALAELLTEPSMSAASDKTLQQSLDNTSSAGVKISAAREMVRKFVDASPENAQKVANVIAKLAMGEVAGDAAPPAEVSPMPEETPPQIEGMPSPVEGGGMPPPVEGEVPPEALEAAAAGVTPEDLVQAEELLAAGEGEAAMENTVPPEVGDAEKTQQMGGGGMGMGGSQAMGAGAAPPSPTI